MNPWKQNLIEFARDLMRFALWLAVILNGLLLALFSIAFVSCCVWRGWGWCWRTLFSEPW